MKKHSIPQNIMEVEFKLFGAFSVRQFGYLAIGFMLSAGVYFLKWPSLVKLIVIPFIGGLGLVLALIKINGQSSSVWILHFIHAFLNPQNRVWKKVTRVPAVLRETGKFNDYGIDRHISARAKKKLPMINTIPLQNLAIIKKNAPNTNVDKVDKYEQIRLKEIENYYKFEINKANKVNSNNIKRKVQLPTMKPSAKQTFNPVNTQPVVSLARDINIAPQNVVINHDGYKASVRSLSDMGINIQNSNNSQTNSPRMIKLKKDIANLQTETNNIRSVVKTPVSNIKSNSSVELISNLSKNINIVRGIVYNKTDKAIPNAVINIVDNKNQLIRRLLSDDQGKFVLKNPLPNGEYFIDIVAENFKFSRYKVILKGAKTYSFQFKSK